MKQKIQKQLAIIEKSKEWMLNALDGEKQRNAYRNIINHRRSLKKKLSAIENNPGVAIYGESQVGKSYLISSLLSREGQPFSIVGENGAIHNFIEEINPRGEGNESTSLVSRFSVNYKPINSSFPIKATLLSPADIVLVLCDSYYNDIKVDHSFIMQKEQIKEELSALKSRFEKQRVQQDVLGEDEVLDIQDYFKENFSLKANNVLFSGFFDEVSLFISKVSPHDWKQIFSLLWNHNQQFSGLFDALIAEYSKLGFSTNVYLPVSAVLRNYGTLLDVERLKEIHTAPNPGKVDANYRAETTALYYSNKQERQVTVQKSYLCALSAELVFPQEEILLSGKPFLKETDLLDFPGARGRMNLPELEINAENIPQLLIRGKVAYLFNKYSEAEKISIFMLCAKHDQPGQRFMPQILANWINKYIGDTPEKREKFITTSQIPPLFIIGTFFNVNLEYNPTQDKADDLSSLKYRWNQRFEKTLETEILDTKTKDWFYNWTKSSPNFQNIFFLRDFVFSESKSQVFKGYIQHKRELEEIHPPTFPDFRQKLRQSFLEYDFVRRHFANPEESWDEAAGMNKDGTQLIIKKLTIAAGNINQARHEKAVEELNEISKGISEELQRYYHSNDKDQELQKVRALAGDIQFKLDTAFSADGIKNFGKLLKELMLAESTVLELFRKKIDDIEHRDVINLDIYSNFRMHVPIIVGDLADSYFERLCAHYEKTTDEQKDLFRKELEDNGIDLEELVSGNSELIKNNAQQLADTLLDYWLAYICMNDKHSIRQILAQGDSTALQDIATMYQKLFSKIKLSEKIANIIREYLEGYNKTDLPYDIIADQSTELLNLCISTVGYKFFDYSEINDLRQANEQNKLGLVLDQDESPTEKSVAELFEKIDHQSTILKSNPEEMKSLPSYRNYQAWYNRLKVGFVSVCDIPNYNVAKNEQLGVIINDLQSI